MRAASPTGLLEGGRYLGRVVSRRRLPGFMLTETTYERGDELPRHAHERAFFCLTLAGAYAEWTPASREVGYEPFTAVFHPAGEEHVTRMGPAGGTVLNVEPDPELLAALAELSAPSTPLRDFGGGALVPCLVRLRRARATSEDAALDAEAEGAELLALAARVSRRAAPPPRWLAVVADRLHADGPAPSLAELGTAAGVHPVHVARAFRRAHGLSPGAYRRNLRLRRAWRLLDAGARPADVAALSGFADQSHLTREIRRAFGTTPAAWRSAAPAGS